MSNFTSLIPCIYILHFGTMEWSVVSLMSFYSVVYCNCSLSIRILYLEMEIQLRRVSHSSNSNLSLLHWFSNLSLPPKIIMKNCAWQEKWSNLTLIYIECPYSNWKTKAANLGCNYDFIRSIQWDSALCQKAVIWAWLLMLKRLQLDNRFVLTQHSKISCM